MALGDLIQLDSSTDYFGALNYRRNFLYEGPNWAEFEADPVASWIYNRQGPFPQQLRLASRPMTQLTATWITGASSGFQIEFPPATDPAVGNTTDSLWPSNCCPLIFMHGVDGDGKTLTRRFYPANWWENDPKFYYNSHVFNGRLFTQGEANRFLFPWVPYSLHPSCGTWAIYSFKYQTHAPVQMVEAAPYVSTQMRRRNHRPV